MSTEELIQSILSYPLIVDIFAYDDWISGIAIVASYFNELDEEVVVATIVPHETSYTYLQMVGYYPYPSIVTVRSKWGSAGLYTHLINLCPYYIVENGSSGQACDYLYFTEADS